MPEKRYQILLDKENLIFVYFETIKGRVSEFVVKYITFIEGEMFEVLRFDSAHGTPHIDVIAPDGETKQKIWLEQLSNERALEYAVNDIKDHYSDYRDKFLQWKSEQK